MSAPDRLRAAREIALRRNVPGLGEGSFFYGEDAATAWNGFFLMLGLVVAVPAGLAIHSVANALAMAGGFVAGVAIWYAGKRVLRENCYFIGSDVFGYRDLFGARFARFDETTGIQVRRNRNGAWLQIEGRTARKRMSLEIDSAWLEAIKEQCAIRGIPVS